VRQAAVVLVDSALHGGVADDVIAAPAGVAPVVVDASNARASLDSLASSADRARLVVASATVAAAGELLQAVLKCVKPAGQLAVVVVLGAGEDTVSGIHASCCS
jgi:hypothetical protein